ncbi:MAG TPA: peptidoglycan DD-metalloendopeptidase family protein [Candidatus Krumholzibacteria bacterium]|nr:peptidoglycan DD-metalloendopeptidase family protein [Candidatus Krumholzibacteria bacterium]
MIRHVRVIVSIMLAVSMVGAFASAQDDDVDSKQQELDRIRREIEEHRARTQQLGSQEKQVLKKLSGIDKNIDLSKKYLRKLSEQEQTLDNRIGDLRTMIGGREVVLTQQEEALGARLRQMYKRDPQFTWEVFLGARSIDDAITRYQFMKLIAAQDAGLIDEFRTSKRALEVEHAQLAESLQEVWELRESRQSETAQLEHAKKQRQTTLAGIRSEKSKHARAIQDLEKAQAELQALIDDIIRRGTSPQDLPPTGEFAAMKGRLLWPVSGKVIRGFGKHTHPKYGTVTMNNGVDIQAPAGAPIVAVAAGVVEFVDWIDAFGKCIILNHGGGYYTLYAHVATTMVSQGQKVGRGHAIAEVGDTGSLQGYVCHFEVRQGRRAMNPTEWLGRKQGS